MLVPNNDVYFMEEGCIGHINIMNSVTRYWYTYNAILKDIKELKYFEVIYESFKFIFTSPLFIH